ncbi:antA/AntB antirepressor family protein [Aeromonas enteropelogenes]|uniref:antA/AntB antirepressor family protein n=1 Tax=Aeromonas enteropelogenes TaxID=29489 RepID=UPI003B9F72BB
MNKHTNEVIAQGGALPKFSQPAQPSLAKWLPLTEQAIEGKQVKTVNARELHAFLTMGRDFSNWIKDRIAEYGFVDGVDFTTVEILSSPNLASTKESHPYQRNAAKARPQRIKEYALSLNMAKELAMVERSDEGRRARRYFIDCEPLRITAAPELNQMSLEQWHGERKASKNYCKLMNDALEESRSRLGKTTLTHYYSNEANLINRLVLGMDANKWAKLHGVSGSIRQHMSAYQLSMVAYLERSNATLLDAGMPFSERKEKLAEMLIAKAKREERA